MKSPRYAFVATLLLALIGAAFSIVGAIALAQAPVVPGTELPFAWRLAIWASNQFIAVGPFLAPVVIALAAGVGVWRSPASTIPDERRTLRTWLLTAVLYMPIAIAVTALAWRLFGAWGLPALIALFSLGAVAVLAAAVVGVHLQSRLAAAGAAIKGWHVAAATLVFAALGPFILLPPAVVWWTSRRAPIPNR